MILQKPVARFPKWKFPPPQELLRQKCWPATMAAFNHNCARTFRNGALRNWHALLSKRLIHVVTADETELTGPRSRL